MAVVVSNACLKCGTPLWGDEECSWCPKQKLGEFTIDFGTKFKGKKLKDLSQLEVFDYIAMLEDSSKKKMIILDDLVVELRTAALNYFGPMPEIEEDVPL